MKISLQNIAATCAFAACVSLSSLSAEAETTLDATPSGNARHALIIGIENYEHYPKAGLAIADATALADLLEAATFQVTRALDTTRSELDAILDGFTTQITPGEPVLIYVAGAGGMFRNRNFLSLKDTQPITSVEDLVEIIPQMLQVDAMLERVMEADPGQVALILDTCRFEIFGNLEELKNGPDSSEITASLQSGHADIAVYSASEGACPTNALSPVYDRSPNSVFMRNLLLQLVVTRRSLQDAAHQTKISVLDQTSHSLAVGDQVVDILDRSAKPFYIMPPSR